MTDWIWNTKSLVCSVSLNSCSMRFQGCAKKSQQKKGFILPFVSCHWSLGYFYLAIGPCDFVDDVCKDNILVVSVSAHLLPLRILSQTNIISEEGVADARVVVSRLVGYLNDNDEVSGWMLVLVKWPLVSGHKLVIVNTKTCSVSVETGERKSWNNMKSSQTSLLWFNSAFPIFTCQTLVCC